MTADKMMLHIVNFFPLLTLCVAQLSDIFQPTVFQSAKLGDSVTIQCFMKSDLKRRVWYKFTTAKGLQPVATFNIFYNQTEYIDETHQRYSVQIDRVNNSLSISATTWDDVGTYFCGVMLFQTIQFGSGTFLLLKGTTVTSDSDVQQSESVSVQPGASAALSCSVHTDYCAEEHSSVTWLKNSQQFAPQMIYISGNKTCQRTESGGASCLYILQIKNLNFDDAGTYYCVATSCGETRFGNGTTINIYNNGVTKPAKLSPTVIALTLSNIILGIVTVVLLWTHCRSCREYSKEATDGSSQGNRMQSDAVIYAAVSLAPRSLRCTQSANNHSGDSVVYSQVRCCQQEDSQWEYRQTRHIRD